MSNILKRAYDRYESEIESDRYSIRQRLVGATALFGVMTGGLVAMDHYEVDEKVIDTVAHIVGHDGEISYGD